MAFALIVLAVGSVLAGYIGLPHALGGSNRLEQWLEPSFSAGHEQARLNPDATDYAVRLEPDPTTVNDRLQPAVRGIRLQPDATSSIVASTVALQPEPGAATEAGEPHAAEANEGLELGLMGLSTLVAFAGIGIAVFFFLKNPLAADRMADRFAGLRTLLLNKYYVDEAYDAAIVQPIRVTSEAALWKVVDAGGIDGLVNGTAETVGGLGELIRRVQTGSVRSYAASLLLGAVVVLGYYLWP